MMSALLLSIVNVSSPIGIWAMINQFQLYLLLLLTGAYIPVTIRGYLAGVEFVSFSFNFIPFKNIGLVSHFYNWLTFSHNNDNLSDIGLKSGSAF